jgi:hypothetical protein
MAPSSQQTDSDDDDGDDRIDGRVERVLEFLVTYLP